MASVPSKSEIQESVGKVADQGDDATHSAAQSLKTYVDNAGDAVGDLYGKGASSSRQALNEGPASLSDIAASGERLALRGRQTLDRGVRNQPVEALLLAGAIGYLVGWAASRG